MGKIYIVNDNWGGNGISWTPNKHYIVSFDKKTSAAAIRDRCVVLHFRQQREVEGSFMEFVAGLGG